MNSEGRGSLDWRLIVSMVPIGLLFAGLTIGGLLPGVEATYWVAGLCFATIGVIVGFRAGARPVMHGFVAGFLAAVVAVETQALFLDTYFANNPQYADVEMPFDWPPRLVTMLGAPINGVVAGFFSAFFAWATSRLYRRPQAGTRGP